MYLKEIKLENFLPYAEATLELPETGLVFIAGPNNSGKSALLAAFDVVAERAGDRQWGCALTGHPARVTAVFEMMAQERERLVASDQNSAYESEWLATPAFTRLEIVYDEFEGQMLSSTVLLSGHDGGMRPIADTELQVGGGWRSRSRMLPSLLSDPPQVADWSLASAGTTIGGRQDPLVSQPRLWSFWEQWAKPLYHFSGVRPGTDRRSGAQGVQPILEPGGANLAQCLLYLLSQSDPAGERIQAVVDEVLPDAGRLVTPVAGSEVEIAFRDVSTDAPRNIKELGTGVEQVLMTAYVGATQPPGGVILIEEPETNLHAAAERELLRHLTEWGSERPIVISTHSTVFLDAAVAAGTWIVQRDQGLSRLRRADSDKTGVLRAVGVRLSDVLSAERLVLVEGLTDAEMLQAWFQGLLLTRRTAVIPLGGGDRAFQLEMIENVLSAADELDRATVFLRDADELSQHSREKLGGLDGVRLLPRREIENYLLDPAAIVTAIENHPGQAAPPDGLTHSRVEELVQSTGDALRGTVILKMVAAELPPVRLADRKAIRSIVRDGGGLAELQEVVASALPDRQAKAREIESLWKAAETELNQRWAADWLGLAPGNEILEAIWSEFGLRYDKRRDGVRIAAAMGEAPEDVRQALGDFLD